MAEQQQHKTTLPKPDPEFYYKKALTEKVDKLLEQCDVKKVETKKKQSINRVVTDTALRRNKTKPHNLDQRCKSPRKYKEKGFLKGTTGTLEENLKTDIDYRKEYHDAQHELFETLSGRFPELFSTHVKELQDEKGYWFLYHYDKKLKKWQPFTTTKFSHFIDKITLKYIKELKGLDVKTLTPSGINELQTIAESCQTIVMGRYLADMICETDFMKVEEAKLWTNHVHVFLSFAALLVILEMWKLKLFPKSKKRPTNQNSFPSDFLCFFSFSVILLGQLTLFGFRLRTCYLLFLLILWAFHWLLFSRL